MTPPEHSIHDYLRRLPLLSDEQAWLLSDRQSKQTLFQQITTMPTEPMTTSAPAQRRVPRRPLAMASTLVAALALAMLALASGMIPNTAPAAYAVREMPNGMLEVEWNGELDGERLAATLRNYDIDVRVETEPASPSLVGTVVGLGPLEDQGDAVFEWGETSSTFTLDPSAFKGTFQILVERPAQPGEAYAAAASVFAEGEVLGGLQCAITVGRCGQMMSPGISSGWVRRRCGTFSAKAPTRLACPRASFYRGMLAIHRRWTSPSVWTVTTAPRPTPTLSSRGGTAPRRWRPAGIDSVALPAAASGPT